jgi:hypothetical protein
MANSKRSTPTPRLTSLALLSNVLSTVERGRADASTGVRTWAGARLLQRYHQLPDAERLRPDRFQWRGAYGQYFASITSV